MSQAAVIFDLDGTLTKPYLNFDAVRAEIGVDGPILEAMEDMNAEERHRVETVLHRYELEAAENACLQDGVAEVLDACRDRAFPIAILTRNRKPNVHIVMEKFGIHVDALRTRDEGAIKPSPDPIFSLCEELGADSRQSWMVGDYLFDIQSGRAAGTHTVLMIGDSQRPEFADQADHVIQQLVQLLPLL
jgi:HAD superfamily hydrolase (TIGR01549 family)